MIAVFKELFFLFAMFVFFVTGLSWSPSHKPVVIPYKMELLVQLMGIPSAEQSHQIPKPFRLRDDFD